MIDDFKKTMKKSRILKYRYHVILFVFLVSLASSLILSTQPISGICSSQEGCTVVQNSEYSYFLGIKNYYYGIAIFSVLSVLTFSQMKKRDKRKERIILASIIAGSAISVWLIYLQIFVLKGYCVYCLIVDVSLILSLIWMIFTRKWK